MGLPAAGLPRSDARLASGCSAKLYQAGLVTRRVSSKGFQDASVHPILLSQAFLAQTASSFALEILAARQGAGDSFGAQEVICAAKGDPHCRIVASRDLMSIHKH